MFIICAISFQVEHLLIVAGMFGKTNKYIKYMAMPKVGTQEYEDLARETGGGSTLPGFDYEAHIAATSKREFLATELTH